MLKSYITIAWRNILRSKVYSAINILGLSLGVACCLLLTLYIHDDMSYDQHHARLNDLYRVNTIFENDREHAMRTVSPPVAHALQAEVPEVEFAARIVIQPGASQNLIKYKDKLFYESQGAIADSTFFNILTYEFLEGNAKDALADAHAVVITDVLATRLFGNESALNQVIDIQGVGTGDFTVTGVIKSNTKTFLPVNFIISMNSSGGMADYINSDRVANAWVGQNFMPTFVRLAEGHNKKEVEDKINKVLQKFAAEELIATNRKKSLMLEPVKDIYLRSDVGQSPRITSLYVIGSIAGFILLIASINFINLSTARATKRAAEIGIRKVMGAFRSLLIRQILSEALIIVLIAAVVSGILVQLALPLFNSLTGKAITLDSINAVYFFGALTALTLITGFIAGSYPAFYISSFQPAQVLKGKFTMTSSSGWLRRSLVVFQFMIAITLVCGVLIISKQLNYMQEKDLGFNADAKIVLPLHTDDTAAKYEVLRNTLQQDASIVAISAANYVPGSIIYSDARLYIEGSTIEDAVNIQQNYVDFGYMQQMEMKLIAGRTFNENRANESLTKVIINRTGAKKYDLEPEAIVGKKLSYDGQGQHFDIEVIGVMEDYNQSSLKEAISPIIFAIAPDANHYNFMVVSVKPDNFKQSVAKIEKIWKSTVEGVPFEYSFLDENIQKQYLADHQVSQIVNSFTAIAMLISCLGLYGLSTFMTERRFKEIGIRKVLGASVSQITGLMSTEFVRLVLVAVIISIPLAWYAMDKWLSGFVYRVSVDAWIFMGAALAALAVALITVSFESIRAAGMNPVKSLRNE